MLLQTAVLAILLALNPARAAGEEPSHVKADLLAEQSSIQPGGKVTLGIRLKMSDGWHTYWRNPGDSGMATTVKWTLPPGFTAGALQWPYPKRFTGKRSTTFGYDDEAVLLADLSVPTRIALKSVPIGAKVDWLECKDICVSGTTRLSVNLPVQTEGKAPRSQNAGVIASARRRLPSRRGAGVLRKWCVRAIRFNNGVGLDVPRQNGTFVVGEFFPYDNSAVGNRIGSVIGGGDGRWATYSLSVSSDPSASKAKRLSGVFIAQAPMVAIEASIPIEKESSRNGECK